MVGVKETGLALSTGIHHVRSLFSKLERILLHINELPPFLNSICSVFGSAILLILTFKYDESIIVCGLTSLSAI